MKLKDAYAFIQKLFNRIVFFTFSGKAEKIFEKDAVKGGVLNQFSDATAREKEKTLSLLDNNHL